MPSPPRIERAQDRRDVEAPARARPARGLAGPWLVAASLLILSRPASADDWPAWRGPTGQGATRETDLPLEWGRERNVRWRTPLPGPGNSTPVVAGGRVFLTQAMDGGRRRATLCLDRKDGSVRWERVVEHLEPEPTHDTNPYCSASPVTDGERVVVVHGSAGAFAYDFEGAELWRKELGKLHHIWGNAASPVIHGGTCYLHCGPGARTFLLALDARSGAERWRRELPGGAEGRAGERESWTGSWSTPLVAGDGDGAFLLVSHAGRLVAHALDSGEELWSCDGLGKLVYTTPLFDDGVAVAMSGFHGPLMAVRGGGAGDVGAARRLWRHERGPQRIGSGVIHRGRIYVLDDGGIAECLELETGKSVWKERAGTRSWSSIVLSGDRLYALDQKGTTHVLRAAPSFEVLARNELGETTRASPAVSNGEVFIRTYEGLWCIGEG